MFIKYPIKFSREISKDIFYKIYLIFFNSSMNLSCTSVIFISKTLTVHAGNSIVYLNIFAFIKLIEAFENASCNHIKNKNGLCSVFNAPFDVKLSDSPLTIVQPDIMVICDKNKLDGKRCNGAPDFICILVYMHSKYYNNL